MNDVTKHYRVTMDSAKSNSIFVHTKEHIYEFKCCGDGLYYVDTSKLDSHKTKSDVIAYSFLNVATANKEHYTLKEVQQADAACSIQGRIGWPSNASYKRFIQHGMIRNCATTLDDIACGEQIYGPVEQMLQGKMTHKRPQHLHQILQVQIPAPVLKSHPCDDIAVNFFFVQQQIYLLMKSRVYKFYGLNANCRGRGKVETAAAIKTFLNAFGLRGIRINSIFGDNKFEKIKPLVAPIHVETCGRDEHVPDIERVVRTVKERSCCTTSTLPYKRIPGVMIDSNIQDKIFWLNQFPPPDNLSDAIGPAGMVLGAPPVDYNTLKLNFGQYYQIFNGTTSTPTPRTIGAIALRPKNSTGSYYFMSLETGKILHSNQYHPLAITEHVISRVETIAANEGNAALTNGKLTFR